VRFFKEWESGQSPRLLAYPILNSFELLKDNWAQVHVIQSDAAGDDGFGYLPTRGSHLFEPSILIPAKDDVYIFETFHHGELAALLHFSRHRLNRSSLLLWITDCQAAAWSVNKSRRSRG